MLPASHSELPARSSALSVQYSECPRIVVEFGHLARYNGTCTNQQFTSRVAVPEEYKANAPRRGV